MENQLTAEKKQTWLEDENQVKEEADKTAKKK